MRNLYDQHLVKGDILTLKVVDSAGFIQFEPAFLKSGVDYHVPQAAKSMRKVAAAKGFNMPVLHVDERWQAEVVAIKVGSPQNVTKDGRYRVTVFLKDFKRIERTIKRILNDHSATITVFSGSRKVSEKEVLLYVRKEQYFDSDHSDKIIEVKYFYQMNEGLFDKVITIRSKQEVVCELQKAHINPSKYFEKLSVWKEAETAA